MICLCRLFKQSGHYFNTVEIWFISNQIACFCHLDLILDNFHLSFAALYFVVWWSSLIYRLCGAARECYNPAWAKKNVCVNVYVVSTRGVKDVKVVFYYMIFDLDIFFSLRLFKMLLSRRFLQKNQMDKSKIMGFVLILCHCHVIKLKLKSIYQFLHLIPIRCVLILFQPHLS